MRWLGRETGLAGEERDLKGEMGECQELGANIPFLPSSLLFFCFCVSGWRAGQEGTDGPPVLCSRSLGSSPDEAGGRTPESENGGGTAGPDGEMQTLPMDTSRWVWASEVNLSVVPHKLDDTGRTFQPRLPGL